jgi:hypothetical protein
LSEHDPVSTSRSSNRTCGSPASGSRTRQHARACDALRGAWQIPEFAGLPQSPCPCRCPRRLEPGPLPSTGITRLHQYYEPLRHPAEPGLALTGLRLVSMTTIRLGFPCCIGLPSVRAVATTPAEEPGACFAHFPSPVSLPPVRAESASASRFSRPAQRSLALRPAHSQSGNPTPYTRGFSRFVASTTAPVATGRSESCRVGLAPTERPCLGTAHPNA